jgi:predicted dehydrogenase
MAVRIAVLGVGFGAKVHIPAFQSEGLEVVALLARRRERAQQVADTYAIPHVFTDLDELLAMDDLDAVSVVTPPNLHREMVLSALASGKHVICEKPFALDVAEAKEMTEEAERTKLTAMVAHEFRYASGRMRVAELLREGYVGEPKLCEVRLFRGPTGPAGTIPEFQTDKDAKTAGGGLLFSPGSHYVDALRHWFGEVIAVNGRLSTMSPERIRDGAVVLSDADDTLFATLEFESGVVAQLSGSKATPFSNESSLVVYGTKGTLVTPQTGPNPPAHGTVLGARIGHEAELVTLDMPPELEPFQDERDDRLMPFRLFTREFLRGIDGGRSPAPNFRDGLACQEVLDALRESSTAGQRVLIAR